VEVLELQLVQQQVLQVEVLEPVQRHKPEPPSWSNHTLKKVRKGNIVLEQKLDYRSIFRWEKTLL
jgi:hypothetical protein